MVFMVSVPVVISCVLTNDMDETTALHTAARRYCEERFSEWVQAYTDLQAKEHSHVKKSFELGRDYSEKAYDTFPRYWIAKHTLIEIERFSNLSDKSLVEMKKLIIAASAKAESQLQSEPKHELAYSAIHEEAEDFRVYVEALTARDLDHVEPLPYRRVLSKEEHDRFWNSVRKLWSVTQQYWFPMTRGPAPQNVLAFHVEYFESLNGQQILRDALKQHGVSRVFLLHEFGDPEYEIELGIFQPEYADGGEQYSTSQSADWIIYASQESSITVGGEWLIDAFRTLHPKCVELTYEGPYSTPDLRGTWKLK
ncbi:MAG: hypothetical protein WA823_12855 [Candidatus Acidiferrales bacterium]